MVAHGKFWMTTFVFQQDLRSFYFNNLLFSITKNGVYNSDISIGTKGEKTKLYITLKKGTTLLFANDYIKNSYDKYERNFGTDTNNADDNSGMALIKCTALEDTSASMDFSSDASPSMTNETLYVISYMQYNPDASVDNNGSGPRFGIFRKSTSSDGASYFTRVVADDPTVYIPEGATNIDPQATQMLYLILGVLQPSNTMSSLTEFNEEWFKSHAFIAKGLPDYRYPMINTKRYPSCDVLVDSSITDQKSTLYVDWSKVCINGDYYDSSVNWQEIYGLETFNNAVTVSKLSDELKITDTEWAKLSNGGLAIDYVFAKTNNFTNEPSGSSLSIANSTPESLPLFTYRYIDSAFTKTTYNPLSYEEVESQSEFFTTYLDKSKTNTDRLMLFIKNKGFMRKVINNIRQSGQAVNYNSIIPVAICFRYFIKDNSRVSGADNFTSRTMINPANVLCLLDLASNNRNYNTINTNVGNIYNVLSVIE